MWVCECRGCRYFSCWSVTFFMQGREFADAHTRNADYAAIKAYMEVANSLGLTV